jgi:hypothetical protein
MAMTVRPAIRPLFLEAGFVEAAEAAPVEADDGTLVDMFAFEDRGRVLPAAGVELTAVDGGHILGFVDPAALFGRAGAKSKCNVVFAISPY